MSSSPENQGGKEWTGGYVPADTGRNEAQSSEVKQTLNRRKEATEAGKRV